MIVQNVSKAFEHVGVITPPPDVRKIVETTASFVAKKPAFENRILQKNGQDPLFAFLHSSNPYHSYYRQRIEHHKEINLRPKQNPDSNTLHQQNGTKLSQNEKHPHHATDVQSNAAITKKTAIVSFLKAERAKQQAARSEPNQPPAEDIFSVISINPPPHALALDVIKLTAQFTARNGPEFLSTLSRKECRNNLFDFLKPMHPHSIIFQRLVDAYKMILPSGEQREEMIQSLKCLSEDKSIVLKDVWYVHDWECQKAEREYEAALNESEKIKAAQIDWYDFLVLETVDFDENVTELPAPVADTRQLPKILAAARNAEQERLKNQRDVDMEVDTVATTAVIETVNVDSDIPADRIRREAPKSQSRHVLENADEATVVLPSGNRVPLSKAQQSMRAELINPLYKSERARAAEKNRLQNLADGEEVARNLARWEQAQRKGVVYNRGDLQEALAVMPKAPVTDADARLRKAEPSGPQLLGATKSEESRPIKRARVEAAVDALSKAKKVIEVVATEIEPTEDRLPGLVAANEWLEKQGASAQVRIKLPIHSNKDWKLEGQEIEMSAPLKRTVGKLKNAIAKFTKLPSNKQKLWISGLGFLKDGMSLASYNVGHGAIISLEVKERGGRKKH